MAGKMKLICVVVMAVVLAVASTEAAGINCGTVASSLEPHVTDKGSLGNCCGGVKDLYSAAKTSEERKGVCSCSKTIAGSCSDLDISKAAGLPKQCGISIPCQISPSTDCSTYRYN